MNAVEEFFKVTRQEFSDELREGRRSDRFPFGHESELLERLTELKPYHVDYLIRAYQQSGMNPPLELALRLVESSDHLFRLGGLAILLMFDYRSIPKETLTLISSVSVEATVIRDRCKAVLARFGDPKEEAVNR